MVSEAFWIIYIEFILSQQLIYTLRRFAEPCCRSSPPYRIGDDPLYLRHMVYGIFLVSRLEIEYLAHSTGKGAATAEHLSALEPACKYHIIGLWDIEKFAVHLLCGDINAAVNAMRNRVMGSSAPQLFAVVISPFKGHAGAEQSLYRLAEMG